MHTFPSPIFNRLFGPGAPIADFRPRQAGERPVAGTGSRLNPRGAAHPFPQRPGEDDRFDILTPDAIRGFIDSLLSLVAAVVVPVTCISLVVGGIVIMNIMLVSVTERTREIGIRKALGARRSDIMLQILIEAVVLAFAGGAIGVGWARLLTTMLDRRASVSRCASRPLYVVLSVFVSGAVGVISGWYPASRAAKLDPMVALRAE